MYLRVLLECLIVSPGLKYGQPGIHTYKVVIQNNCPSDLKCFMHFFPSVWSCRSSGEAPADLPHLPPPAACGQPARHEGCRHHTGPLQETVHAERRPRSEEDHESCSAGMAERHFFTSIKI